jgi:hypothetical protein
MAVAHMVTTDPQTWQAPIKFASLMPGWPPKLPCHVQTDASPVLAPPSRSNLEEQDSSAISALKSPVSSIILAILHVFQSPQIDFWARGIDDKLFSSYFDFHFRFRCDADNGSITKKLCLCQSETNHSVHDCRCLTTFRSIPLFEYDIDCCGARFLREPFEEEISSNLIGSGLIRPSLFFCIESVKEILELCGGSRVVIPSSIEVISQSYVDSFGSFESIVFEKASHVQRIEESAFCWSGLKSIIIPLSVEILCTSCFDWCKSLESVIFENGSRLQRIEDSAFYSSGLKSIIIPSSVEILCKRCFANCKSLESILFENDSKLIRIEESAFLNSSGFLLISDSIFDRFRRRAHCQLALITPS